MLRIVDAWFRPRSPLVASSVAASLTLLLAWVNSKVPAEISFSVFYLLPIALATWYAGRWIGLAFSVAAAGLWLVATYGYSSDTSSWIPYWNATVRLGFFSTVALLLALVRAALEREHVLARTDSLTGLLSSRGFHEVAEAECARARRYGHVFTIAYIDADNFKAVNDTRGHAEGDRVLAAIGRVVRSQLRAVDVAARMGGDEFALLLPETNADQATVALQKLREALGVVMHDELWPVTFSTGAVACQRVPSSVDEMLKLADQAMYEVKRDRKDAIRVTQFG